MRSRVAGLDLVKKKKLLQGRRVCSRVGEIRSRVAGSDGEKKTISSRVGRFWSRVSRFYSRVGEICSRVS